MNDKKKFSWAVVRLLIRRYINENSRQLWMSCGVVFGIMFLMALLINGKDNVQGAVMWFTFLFIGSIALGVSSSLTFSSMSTKPKRIVAMMVPASKGEKFASLMIIYNVFGPLAIVLSALAADTLSSLIHLNAPYFFNAYSFITNLFPSIYSSDFSEYWGVIIEVSALVILGFASLLLCNQAFYTLGSALWPKKSYIKTFCALYVIQMVFSIFFSIGIVDFHWVFGWLADLDFRNVSWHLVSWIALIVWYAVIYLIFYAAWRRYKNTQLVQKFMMN